MTRYINYCNNKLENLPGNYIFMWDLLKKGKPQML